MGGGVWQPVAEYSQDRDRHACHSAHYNPIHRVPFSFVVPGRRLPRNLFSGSDFTAQREFFAQRPAWRRRRSVRARARRGDWPRRAAGQGRNVALRPQRLQGGSARRSPSRRWPSADASTAATRWSAPARAITAAPSRVPRAMPGARRASTCRTACRAARVAAIESEGASVVPSTAATTRRSETMAADAGDTAGR